MRLSMLIHLFPISLSIGFVLLIILLQEIFNCLKLLTLFYEKEKQKNLKKSSCKDFEPHNIRLCNFIEKKTSIIFSQASNTEKNVSFILERFPKHMALGIQLELTEEKSLIFLCFFSSFLVT